MPADKAFRSNDNLCRCDGGIGPAKPRLRQQGMKIRIVNLTIATNINIVFDGYLAAANNRRIRDSNVIPENKLSISPDPDAHPAATANWIMRESRMKTAVIS